MNPETAISVHLAWKLALHHAVQTGVARNLDAAALGRDDRCELGLWLEGPTACFEGAEELRGVHRDFHAVAGQLVARLQAAAPRKDLDRLETELGDLSERLVRLLGARG